MGLERSITVANIGPHCLIWGIDSVAIQPALSGVELQFLQTLDGTEPTISRMAQALNLSYAYAWFITKRLETRGLVELSRRNGNGIVIRALAQLVEDR